MVTGCVIVGQPCSMSEMTLPARAAPSSSIRRGQNKPGDKGLCFMLNKDRIRSLFAASRYFTVAGLVVAFWANAATAAGSCQGTYAATLLQPLPAQVVVGLDIRDRSPRNLQLAERFLTGIRDAGIVVGAQPNVLLHVSISQLGGVSSRQSRGAEQSDSELSGIQGGPQLSLPALPSTGLTAPRSSRPPPLLFLRVDATEGKASRISWVASVQCRMIGSDEGQLAQDLGHVIGSALGQRVERRPL